MNDRLPLASACTVARSPRIRLFLFTLVKHGCMLAREVLRVSTIVCVLGHASHTFFFFLYWAMQVILESTRLMHLHVLGFCDATEVEGVLSCGDLSSLGCSRHMGPLSKGPMWHLSYPNSSRKHTAIFKRLSLCHLKPADMDVPVG